MKEAVTAIITLTLSSLSLCTIASAQTVAPSATPAGPTAAGTAAGATEQSATTAGSGTLSTTYQDSSPEGLRMADKATLAVRFVTVKPAAFMASRLIGTDVYNNQNEAVGEIEDLVVDNGKTVSGVVVSVGGFLGIGESYVVLDPTTVVLSKKDNSWKAFVDTSKDSLKNAPKFSYDNR